MYKIILLITLFVSFLQADYPNLINDENNFLLLSIIIATIILIFYFLNKKMEKKSKELELFKKAIDYVNVGVAISEINNGKHNIIYVNKTFSKITGYSRDEVIGKNLRFLQSDDTKQTTLKTLREALEEQKSCKIEIRNYKKDGTLFYNLLTLSPVFDKNNKLINYIGIQKDLTEQKEQEKLISNKSKLISMGEMIGNIAHQWRQPLSFISTAATGIILKKEHDILEDKFLIDNCHKIDEHSQYLSQTIDNFRNFIKGDSKVVRFDLKNDTKSFINLVDSSIKKYNIQIILDLEEHIDIVGYPNELIQCFINLFNNSKDALIENNNENNRFVFISQKVIDNNISIIFKDNAGGIPEDIIDKIFEPYFTTKHQSQGTGLGLHMTYNFIINSMKGDLKVTNVLFDFNEKVNRGAQFNIMIPFN